VIRASAASRSSSVNRPFFTDRSKDAAIRALADAAFSSLRAASTVSYPAFANTSAIPLAMVPEPATPTDETGRPLAVPASPPGVSVSAMVTDDPGAS
jgi:hypothetical protein